MQMRVNPAHHKLSRKQFLQELAEFATQQRDLVEASVSGFAVSAQASEARRERARIDYRFFAETYFPHYVPSGSDASVFQSWVYDTFIATATTPGALRAVAAPRGEGKSTLLTQIGALWLICHGLSPMIAIIMGATAQAEEMLEIIKAELECNPRLAMDFPAAVGKGRIWRAGVIVTAGGTKVKCYGAGKRLRGARNGPHRVGFVFLDDLENDENVRSKEQRDKSERWLKSAVMELGHADGSMRAVYAGTMLHHDSVLARTMKSPRWKGSARVFSSVINWPDRMDLWDAWEAVLELRGQDDAAKFYADMRAEMDRGAVVSWPTVRSLYQLMLKRSDSHRAFATEQQNSPEAGESCPFSGHLQYWVHPARDWVFVGAHDPSMGKHARRGDPAATLVGGYDRVHGKLSVVEALIRRRPPDRQIDDIIRLHAEYQCLVWGIEAVQFQEFFRLVLVSRSAESGQHVPARPINTSSDKALRIESLQPHVANGLILFNRNQRTLIEQIEHWPEADHDDGPDALEMLWQLARRAARRGSSAVVVGRRPDSHNILSGYDD